MNQFQPIFAFLDWWGGELRSFVPRPLQRIFGTARAQLVVRLDGRTVEAFHDRGSGLEPIAATEVTPDDWGDLGTNFAHALGVGPAKSVETKLMIGASQVVRRNLRLPPTPDRDLPGLLSFEIERHTPFNPDEAYFSYRRDATHGDSMDVTINVAPRRIVDPLIAALSHIGFPPNQVMLGDGDTRGVRELGAPATRGGIRVAGIALALLLIAAVVSPLLRLEAIAEDLAISLQAARQTAGIKAGDNDGKVLAARRFLEDERNRRPSPIAILNELSLILPDGTWLVQYGQTDRDITLEGQTTSSADLIPRLEASPRFDAVQFDAPVIRGDRQDRERFTFSLRLAGGAS
ncbi:MAG: PilN domain-containing protein [Alphaproteobacteria bacterium]